MSIFSEFEVAKRDHAACMDAISAALDDMREIAAEVKNRIAQERSIAAGRIEELRETVADGTRSETVRRIAAQNLAELESKTFTASPAEVAAFDAAYQDFSVALTDADLARSTFAECRVAANNYIEAAKKEVAQDWELSPNRLCEKVLHDFEQMRAEVQA